MSDQRDERNSSNGCLTGFLFTVGIGLALVLGGVGGAMLDDPQAQRQITIYPAMTPEAATLYVPPTVAPLAQPVDDCANADPTAPVPGWEKGVGGILPPCYAQWDRVQQNAFHRSH